MSLDQLPVVLGLPGLGTLMAFVVVRLWVQRKLVRGIERDYGLTVLPWTRFEGRRLARSAAQMRAKLQRDLVSGDLQARELRLAIVLQLPVRRPQLKEILARGRGRRKRLRKEVYSDRLEGRSLFLAQLAEDLSKSHLVFWGRWPELAAKWTGQGGKVPPMWHELALLRIARLRLRRPPLFVLEDCPPKDGSPAEVARFAAFLNALDRTGCGYVLGVPRTRRAAPVEHWRVRSDAPGENHVGWLSHRDAYHLQLGEDEAPSLVSAWRDYGGVVAHKPFGGFWRRRQRVVKRQLLALHDCVWQEDLARLQISRPQGVREFLSLAAQSDADQRLALEWIAVAQIVAVAVPEAALEDLLGGEGYLSLRETFRGFIRRDNDDLHDRSGEVVLHFGGPHLATVLLHAELQQKEKLEECLGRLVEWTTTRGRDDVQEIWQRVLHRLAGTFPTVVPERWRLPVATSVYLNNRRIIEPPNTLQGAALLRRLNESDAAGEIYRRIWRRDRPRPDAAWLAATSLVIGLKDTAPHVIASRDYLEYAQKVAGRYKESGKPRIALGLADALMDAVRQQDHPPTDELRSGALAEAERLAVAALHLGYRAQAGDLLAQLVGGLAGPYHNHDGVARPDLEQAEVYAQISLSPVSDAEGLNDLTYQAARTHHVLYRVYREAGRDEDAEEHLRASLFDPSRSPGEYSRAELTHQLARSQELAEYLSQDPVDTTRRLEALSVLDQMESLTRDLAIPVRVRVHQSIGRVLWRHFPEQWLRTSGHLRSALELADSETEKAARWSLWAVALRDRVLDVGEAQLSDVLNHMLDAIEAAAALIEQTRRAESRTRIVNTLGWLFFPKHAPRGRKQRLAETCCAPVWDVLMPVVEADDDWADAVAALIRLGDNFANLVGSERVAQLEHRLDVLAATRRTKTKLRELLAEEERRKRARRLPCDLNARLLGRMVD